MKRKKDKKIKILILVIILLLIIFGLLFIILNSNKLRVYIDSKMVANIGDEIYNTDAIKNIINGEVVSKKEIIDTTKVGKYNIEIVIKDKYNNEKTYKVLVEVIDTIAPVIEFKDNIIVEKGSSIDLLENVTVTDNSNEEIEITIKGDYDLDKVGKYELYYVAKDSSNNVVEEKFTLEVIEKVITTSSDSSSTYTTFTTSKGYSGYVKDGVTYIGGLLIVNKTYSIPSSYAPGDLTSETRSAMNKMFTDASALGLNIYLSSGYRSYFDQKYIYNNYVSYDGVEIADTYSARPGHSEHQTGLAFDVNQINNTFDDTPEAIWLANNCYKYGFILRYPKGKTNETGYMYESWHFRYVGDVSLAEELYNNGNWITLEDYFGITSKYNY